MVTDGGHSINLTWQPTNNFFLIAVFLSPVLLLDHYGFASCSNTIRLKIIRKWIYQNLETKSSNLIADRCLFSHSNLTSNFCRDIIFRLQTHLPFDSNSIGNEKSSGPADHVQCFKLEVPRFDFICLVAALHLLFSGHQQVDKRAKQSQDSHCRLVRAIESRLVDQQNETKSSTLSEFFFVFKGSVLCPSRFNTHTHTLTIWLDSFASLWSHWIQLMNS